MAEPVTWLMVGGGDPTHILCGEYNGKADQCPTKLEGHYYKRYQYNCKKVICPECYEKKIHKMAFFALERFQDVRKAYYLQGHDLAFGELILSPPAELYTSFENKARLATLRKTVIQYAEQCGIVGGMVVVHPWRGRKPVMDSIRQRKRTPKKAYHIHIVGLRLREGWAKSDQFYDRTGWVYKWVDEYTKSGQLRNMYSKIAYELNHAGIPLTEKTHGQIDTWIGICSRQAVKQIKTVTHEPIICPVCQIQAHRYEIDESVDRGPSEHKVTHIEHPITETAIARARHRYKLEPGPRRYETLEGVIGSEESMQHLRRTDKVA